MHPLLQTLISALLLVLMFSGGYYASGYIIRWNEKHLTGTDIDKKRLWAAVETNADYRLHWGRNIAHLRIVMTILSPITIGKAIFLRIRGGSL
ncbi:MAG: hypothetical protein WC045_00235 [Patescibacteria group bacterium]